MIDVESLIISLSTQRQTYVFRFVLMLLIALLAQHHPEQMPAIISKVRSANKEENSHQLQRPYIQNSRVIGHRKSRYRRYEGQRPKNRQHTGCT
jgi:hypothetical protein